MEREYNQTAIEEGLGEIRKMLPATGMSALRRTVDMSLQKLHEPMQLAIIGKISSSKSTLVNAILGKPDVMATGQMEVTYNVGWLKYGSPKNDIIIHHKDGSPDTRKRPEDFVRWMTETEGKADLINNVSYIETFDDAEILRDINIIDTPGLDAVRGTDSQNTLDFLKNVRPDAVIMLFTHSVAESTLDVVRDFNRGGNFNPLNAIGVLSKIDVLWLEDAERSQTALEIGRRIAGNKMKDNPMLRKTLFGIYPVSALMFMDASTTDEHDIDLLRRLATSDPDMLLCAMLSAGDFVDPSYTLAISVDQRAALLKKYDLYGIDLIANYLKANPEATANDVRQLLYRESGAKEFMTVLHNHFGSRAKLIKLESVYQNLRRSVLTERASVGGDMDTEHLLLRIDQRISDLFSALVHEHEEYELMNRIYCHEIEIDDEAAEEFLRLCGEHGCSAPARLGMDKATASPADMVAKAEERESYWRRELNSAFDPDEKEWMRTVLSSYVYFKSRLKEMAYQYEQARAFLYEE